MDANFSLEYKIARGGEKLWSGGSVRGSTIFKLPSERTCSGEAGGKAKAPARATQTKTTAKTTAKRRRVRDEIATVNPASPRFRGGVKRKANTIKF
jgi:hypothetical protein